MRADQKISRMPWGPIHPTRWKVGSPEAKLPPTGARLVERRSFHSQPSWKSLVAGSKELAPGTISGRGMGLFVLDRVSTSPRLLWMETSVDFEWPPLMET